MGLLSGSVTHYLLGKPGRGGELSSVRIVRIECNHVSTVLTLCLCSSNPQKMITYVTVLLFI